MDLFEYMAQNTKEKESPLASRLRPSKMCIRDSWCSMYRATWAMGIRGVAFRCCDGILRVDGISTSWKNHQYQGDCDLYFAYDYHGIYQ